MTPSDLEQPVILSVLGAGLVTAFLHAALPTHWLPFVLVGRAQRWTLPRMLGAVTAGDAAGFFESVAADGDSRRICGLSPIYTFLRALPGVRRAKGSTNGTNLATGLPALATITSSPSLTRSKSFEK